MDARPTELEIAGVTKDIPLNLDPVRERAFHDTVLTLRQVSESKPEIFPQLIATALNDEVISQDEEPIKAGDLSSLEYFEAVSMSASELAGQEVTRPVFIIQNPQEYDKLYKRFAARDPGSPAAFYLRFQDNERPVKNIVGRAIRKSGIIVSRSKNSRIIGHEIRHTIDKNSRHGFDSLISEAFACATDFMGNQAGLKKVLRAYYSVFSDEEKGIERRKMLSGEGNSPRFGTYDKTGQWFGGLVDRMADKLFSRIGEVGRVSAQRELANCHKLEDYIPN